MKKINKSTEPALLTEWKRSNPGQRYESLGHREREHIRHSCSAEQHYLCAYCCQFVSGESSDTVNEHILPRSSHPQLGLVYDNILASCTSKGQCDDAHGHKLILLTPLMDECEHELKFKISGRVEGLTERAQETIEVLNLGDHERNNRPLIEKRKALSHTLMLTNGVDPSSPLEDDDLLRALIEDLNTPVEGKLPPFAPVVANILRGWICG